MRRLGLKALPRFKVPRHEGGSLNDGTIEKQGRVEALPFSIIKAFPNFHKAGASS
jgi:hypothetical protein